MLVGGVVQALRLTPSAWTPTEVAAPVEGPVGALSVTMVGVMLDRSRFLHKLHPLPLRSLRNDVTLVTTT